MSDYRNPSHNVYALMVKNGRGGSGEYYKPSTGESIPVRSGTRNSLYGTPGDRWYLVGNRMGPSNNAMRVSRTTGKGKKKKTETVGYKYELIAITEEGERSTLMVKDENGNLTQGVWDPIKKDFRTYLRIHPDGGAPGSAGCLVTPDVASSKAFETMVTPNGSLINVKYFDTQEQLDAYKKQLDELYKKKPASTESPPSTTEPGPVLRNGETSVRVGADQRPAGYANGACIHSGGVQVAEGSDVVRVGPGQLPLSRETDLCRDNSAIKKTQ